MAIMEEVFFWLISLVFKHRRLSPYASVMLFFTDTVSSI